MPANSSSVNGSSRPLEAKSKFSASDSRESASISSGSRSISAAGFVGCVALAAMLPLVAVLSGTAVLLTGMMARRVVVRPGRRARTH